MFARAARYPEIVLSRRDIIKYIIVEAARRAEQVQALLKLERIREFRAALRTATNSLKRKAQETAHAESAARVALKETLTIDDLGGEALLARINELRRELSASPLKELRNGVRIEEGVADRTAEAREGPSRSSLLSDLEAVRTLTEHVADDADIRALNTALLELGNDPALRKALEKRHLLTLGLDCIEDDQCPLCGEEWDEEELRAYLLERLESANRAAAIEKSMQDGAIGASSRVARLIRYLESLRGSATALALDDVGSSLQEWLSQLQTLQTQLGSPTEQLRELIRSEIADRLSLDQDRTRQLEALQTQVERLPELAPQTEARQVLTQAQLRLDDARKAERVCARAKRLHKRAERVLGDYDSTVNRCLESLFESVQNGLSDFYRRINEDDESGFEAQLKYESGAATLEVDFYDRGFFHPGAYHSEGHQDGMGLCLYLALMKELLGKDFSLSVLDDVVMSVDANHRKSVCGIIRECFPDTQFIITTHDRLWMQQMRASGVATGKQLLVFGRWSVDTGPVVAIAGNTWERTEELLREDDVPGAAAALRHYIEYSAWELGTQIGAKVTLRSDGDYEINDLLPAMIRRWDDLLKKAHKAATSWEKPDEVERVARLQRRFAGASQGFREEQWAVNPAVHFNEWAQFSVGEFRSVVNAYKELLAGLECSRCDSWVFLERAGATTSSVRCHCKDFDFNLVNR